DIRKRTRRIDGRDRDTGGETLAVVLVDIPAHVDPAFGLIVESGQRRRLDRIDGDARSGLDDADNAVTRHRAFRRKGHRQVAAHTPDRQRAILWLGLVLAGRTAG